MSLERIQASTNRQRVGAGNLSASNDPTQWEHDGREQLLKGAELAAAGRTLGLSEEETLAAVSRQFRRQRRADDSVTPQDVVRNMAQSLATVKEVAPEEIKGVSTGLDYDTAFAQGEDIEYYKQYGSTRADDEQTYRADDKGMTQDEETGLVRKKRFNEERPTLDGYARSYSTTRDPVTGKLVPLQGGDYISLGYADATAPQSPVQDALTRLQGAISEQGYDALPGSADVETRLEDQLRKDTGAERSLARELVKRDQNLSNPEVEEANYYRAETEALAERRRLYGPGGSGARADGNIARIGDIHSIGKVYTDAHQVRSANDAIQGQIARRHDGVFLDPRTGNPVAVQGPELPAVLSGDRTPNNTGTADNLNAPQTAREWLTTALDTTLERTKGSPDIPQVDITASTTNFANRVRDYYRKNNLEVAARVPENIRSVEELQRVVDRVVGVTGGNLTMPNPENPGTQMPAGRNRVQGALNALGMPLGEQQEFGQAMYQLDAARRSSVNQNPTGVYLSRTGGPTEGVTFKADDQLRVARIPKGSTIGVKVEGKDKPVRRSIVTQLSQLSGEDAQKPFIGLVEGEKPRRDLRSAKGAGEGVDAAIALRKQAEERSQRTGRPVDGGRIRQNQVKTMLVQEREKRDNATRAEAASTLISQLPPNARRTRLRGR